jgi:hypothetical protein
MTQGSDLEKRIAKLEERQRDDDEKWAILEAHLKSIEMMIQSIGCATGAGQNNASDAIIQNLKSFEDAARTYNFDSRAISRLKKMRKFFEDRRSTLQKKSPQDDAKRPPQK